MQRRLKSAGKWIVIERDHPTDEVEALLPSWSFVERHAVNSEDRFTDRTGVGAGLEAILMLLRSSEASHIFITSEDWNELEKELKKPVVPTHGLMMEYSDTPRRSNSC